MRKGASIYGHFCAAGRRLPAAFFFERNNMEHTEQFQQEIAPFFWVNLDGGHASVCLNVGTYLQEVFDTRADEGFEGKWL